jgi:orotidine-5'-phosphate decarboxylase
MTKTAAEYLSLALDNVSGLDSLRTLIRATGEHIGVFKIGLEQFTRFGPAVLDEIRGTGRKIFLDLKLHDIPNTVAKAVDAAAAHNVDLLTVHTQGGLAMLRAAGAAASAAPRRPKVIGVTVLTSIDGRTLSEELSVSVPLDEHVRRLAGLAAQAGLDGIVCSAADLPSVKPSLPPSFEFVTPGIRLADGSAGDQKRIATPEAAIANGSTLLVVGRPITSAPDPREAARTFERCVAEHIGT